MKLWYLKFRIKEISKNIKWRIAWMIPRSIALICFVRVFSAGNESPCNCYQNVYENWEKGAGR